MRVIIKINIAIFIISFVLNYLWEVSHSVLYIPSAPIADILPLYLVYASFIDALLITGIYWVLVLINQDSYWFKEAKIKDYAIVIVMGLVVSVFIEVRAVYFFNKWQYGSGMPVIPFLQVGLTPVLQMLVLPVLTFLAVKNFYKKIWR